MSQPLRSLALKLLGNRDDAEDWFFDYTRSLQQR